MVTLVINSCGRLDLLDRTMASFNKFNTFPIAETILVDDSGDPAIHDLLRQNYPDFTLILERHRGLIPCVDDAFSRVKTPYLFKIEEDWEFYKKGFIEKSMKILKAYSDILLVWLRDRSDTNAHPVEDKLMEVNGVTFSLLSLNFRNEWHGFTFNPSLWRVEDYKRLAPFENIAGEGNMGMQEMNIGYWYMKLGYRAVILKDGYVKHIGWGRRSYSV